jgi:riboflavin kinase
MAERATIMTFAWLLPFGDLKLPKKLRLKGTVISGSGEGAKFVKLSWVKRQIAEKLGFTPYLGTLNIKLSEDDVKKREIMVKAKSIEISPAANFHSGKCYRASLKNYAECAVIVPSVPNYPEDVLEIVAPTNLRKELGLKDGNQIEIEVTLA